MFPSTQNKSGVKLLMMAVMWYIIAKVLEHFDEQIYPAGELISGHPLKHLAAAIATWCLVMVFKNKHVNQVSLTFS